MPSERDADLPHARNGFRKRARARALIIYRVVIRAACPLFHFEFVRNERERKGEERWSQGRSVWVGRRGRKSRSLPTVKRGP